MKFLLRLMSISAPVLLAGGIGIGYGQSDSSLSDPTRPPMVAADPAAPSNESIPPPSGLQTVILGKGHRPMAVINGVTVGLGDKIGEAVLVKLTESEAVLQGPGGKETLYLTPDVKKINSPDPKQDAGAGKKARRTKGAGTLDKGMKQGE